MVSGKLREEIDYNKEYSEFLRCPNCNRRTSGIDDFKNVKTGRIVKTCIRCRECVGKSLRKKPRIKVKAITNKERLEMCKLFLTYLDADICKKIIEEHPEAERVINDLFPQFIKEEQISDDEA